MKTMILSSLVCCVSILNVACASAYGRNVSLTWHRCQIWEQCAQGQRETKYNPDPSRFAQYGKMTTNSQVIVHDSGQIEIEAGEPNN